MPMSLATRRGSLIMRPLEPLTWTWSDTFEISAPGANSRTQSLLLDWRELGRCPRLHPTESNQCRWNQKEAMRPHRPFREQRQTAHRRIQQTTMQEALTRSKRGLFWPSTVGIALAHTSDAITSLHKGPVSLIEQRFIPNRTTRLAR